MARSWRDPVRLPKHVRWLCESVALAGPIAIAVVAVLAVGFSAWSWCAIGFAAATLLADGVLRVANLVGHREKFYIDAILERLGDEVWRKKVDKLSGPREQHRITLFQLKRRLLRRRRWTHILVPCTRHPQSGRRPRRRFRVHEHIVENCEAVAGLVFAKGNKGLVTGSLPNLHAQHVSDADFRDYAEKTNDDLRIVKRERYYAQIIGGLTIYSRGKRWGVVMLDSCDPQAIDSSRLSSAAVQRLLGVVSKIVSGVRL